MEEAVARIIDSIPRGCSFDSHFVIARLVKEHSDQYLIFASGIATDSNKTLSVHGKIGQQIARLDGRVIDRMGDSWSENIHGSASKCASWRKR